MTHHFIDYIIPKQYLTTISKLLFISLTLVEATYHVLADHDDSYVRAQSEVVLPVIYVSGRHVTFVHLPEDTNVSKSIDAQVNDREHNYLLMLVTP